MPSPRFTLVASLTLAIVVGLGADGPAQPKVDMNFHASQSKRSALKQALAQLVDRSVNDQLPGLAVRIQGPGFNFVRTAGFADVDRQIPVWRDHPFHVASIGKMFVGAAIARLVDDSLVSLDATLATLLPQVASRFPSSETITLRQLLQHTSGIVDVPDDIPGAFEALIADPAHVWTNAELITFAFDHPLQFEPGSGFYYSDVNYMLAALVMEAVTGRSHAQVLRDLIFAPLGMVATVTSNHEPLLEAPAHGYFRNEAFDQPVDVTAYALRWEAGSGGQWSTVDDLTRYLHFFAKSSTALSDRIRALILTPSEHRPYGLGIVMAETPFGPIVGHDGQGYGYTTRATYFLDPQTSIVILGNGETEGIADVVDELTVAIALQLFGD